ncbi:MAG: HAMP domain-containing sensor histidine kinase [Actinomycetota bacterium]
MRIRLAAAFAVLTATTAGAAWLGTELVMAPSGSERTRLIAMYAAIAAAVFVIGMSLMGITRRSISRRMLAVGIAGPLVVGAITIGGAGSMFISSHDTQFIVILAAAATALAAGLVNLLVAPLLRDLQHVANAAEAVGDGDLTARAAIDRPDELGELGRTFDEMADRLQAATEDRERVEEQRRFMISSLSHDARTPLTAMRATLEALQDGLAPDPDRYLESIGHDLRSIEAIVENMFVIAKLEADQLDPFIEEIDLAEIAESTVIALEPLARKHDTSLAVRTDGPVPARCARIETERMIGNLLTNAIRHSPPEGEVQIVVHATPRPTVAVIDDGPGFDPEFVDRAFEHFVRDGEARDRAHGGAGLGLAVVRGLAEAMGGRAWADAGPGGRVSFELPARR